MTTPEPPPAWNLPEGVDPPLWHYTHSPRLAEDEDEYFRDHPLFEADARILRERFVHPGRLIDLGCGAGRLSLDFARRGFDVTAVDLSGPMLRTVVRKARAEGLGLSAVQANLCRLGTFPAASFDYGISMFSTIGMIRGPEARARALAEVARILKPGGCLALHAHNLWLNLGDPQGRRWLLGEWLRGRRSGDRTMAYRGVPGLTVHLFRWRELAGIVRGAGFAIEEAVPLDAVTAQVMRFRQLWPSLRAGGWIVFARRR